MMMINVKHMWFFKSKITTYYILNELPSGISMHIYFSLWHSPMKKVGTLHQSMTYSCVNMAFRHYPDFRNFSHMHFFKKEVKVNWNSNSSEMCAKFFLAGMKGQCDLGGRKNCQVITKAAGWSRCGQSGSSIAVWTSVRLPCTCICNWPHVYWIPTNAGPSSM